MSQPPPLPPQAAPLRQHQDLEHLKLLAIFHYVLAGVLAFFSSWALIYYGLGMAMLTGAMNQGRPGQGEEQFVGLLFVGIGIAFIMLGLGFGMALVVAGRSLAQQIHYRFCVVMAGMECLYMPIGTVLGVFTLIVLTRPSVRARFPR